MNIKEYINELSLTNGDTKRLNCPVCNGYKTFTVTNNMGSLVWNCYKVSCSVSGGTRVHLTADDIRKSLGSVAEETHAVAFDKPDHLVVDYSMVQNFCRDWCLNPKELGLLYDVREDRVVFPVMQGKTMVDGTGRSLGGRLPKWKKYGNSGLPYTWGYGKTAVVVEDCVSAAVVGGIENGGLVGVAVLGTSLSDMHKQYLSQFSAAIIALDPDALPKTLQFRKELRGYVDDVKVLRLNDDLKYQNETDLENLTALEK
jgi:hypothetical protein